MKKFKQTKTTEYHCVFHNEELVNANLPRNMSISDLSDSIIDAYRDWWAYYQSIEWINVSYIGTFNYSREERQFVFEDHRFGKITVSSESYDNEK